MKIKYVKRKSYGLLLCAFISFGICSPELARQENVEKSMNNTSSTKKKILILTSFGGGGNLEASKALESYLRNDYTIELCSIFKDILYPLDPFSLLTANHYSGEEFYNLFVSSKHFSFLGWLYSCGVWYIQAQKANIHSLFKKYLMQNKPDVIISVVPIVNNIILTVSEELNIPFLLIPTDLDINPYIININNPTYTKFHIGLIFDDQEIIKPLKRSSIRNFNIIGAPLRPDFFSTKDKSLRKEHGIEQNKLVIMILMGSHGSYDTEKYVGQLLKLTEPAHIFACIGKNEQSRKNLSQLKIPPHISLSIIGFTNKIADYMAMSDILISKSGTLSVCEALYMNLPILLDATSTALPWEKFNHHFIKKHHFGDCIKRYEDIIPLIGDLKANNLINRYKNNIKQQEKKLCPTEIKRVIERIVKQ